MLVLALILLVVSILWSAVVIFADVSDIPRFDGGVSVGLLWLVTVGLLAGWALS